MITKEFGARNSPDAEVLLAGKHRFKVWAVNRLPPRIRQALVEYETAAEAEAKEKPDLPQDENETRMRRWIVDRVAIIYGDRARAVLEAHGEIPKEDGDNDTFAPEGPFPDFPLPDLIALWDCIVDPPKEGATPDPLARVRALAARVNTASTGNESSPA